MCHCALSDASFWRSLLRFDQDLAEQTRAAGCPSCGSVLHVANYPRKPRGAPRRLLGSAYSQRLSFCCANADCRRRTTPPSVRFLGRKVYLGAAITLLGALEHGLTTARRRALIESLSVPAQTLHRWRRWWRETLTARSGYLSLSGWFSPPIDSAGLPGSMLARMRGADVAARCTSLLHALAPVTTCSCPHLARVAIDPQRM